MRNYLGKVTMRGFVSSMIVASAFAFSIGAASEANAADAKIAVVDMQRAVTETQAGANAQATLKKLFSSRQSELETKQKELSKKKDALDKAAKGGKIPQPQLQQQAEQLQKEFGDYQQVTLTYQREMQQKEGELTQPILQGVLAVVRRIAAQEGYEVVLEKSAAPYFRADLDVTDKAIQLFNQQGGVAPPGKAPAAPAPAKPAPSAPPAPKKP
jgi:outer membrane protein